MLLVLVLIFTAPAGLPLASSGPHDPVSAASAPKGRAQRSVRSGDSPMSIGGFLFRIARVAFDATAMGFVPENMGPKDRLMFIEFELLSGNRDDFMGLVITLSGGSGKRTKPAVLASGGLMKTLSAMTITSAPSRYRPENANIAWAYVVPEGERDFFLTFPTGDVVSLAPLIKEDRAETARPTVPTS